MTETQTTLITQIQALSEEEQVQIMDDILTKLGAAGGMALRERNAKWLLNRNLTDDEWVTVQKTNSFQLIDQLATSICTQLFVAAIKEAGIEIPKRGCCG